jgi:predicted nucleic acid-binding protein
MKVFIDANILVTVLNKAYPLFPYAARVLSLAGHPRFTLYTSPLCLAIAFYFAEMKSGKSHARKKMTLLAEKLAIAGLSATAVSRTLLNKYRTWKMDLNIMGRRGWL